MTVINPHPGQSSENRKKNKSSENRSTTSLDKPIPSTKQQLTHAHGWLGVISSSVLCLIFWFGGLSLFRTEIQAWSEAPSLASSYLPTALNSPEEGSGPNNVLNIIEKILPQYDFDHEEHLSILTPQPKQPYYQFYIDIKEKDGIPQAYEGIKVNAESGEILGKINQYPLATFFYQLHYSGHMGKVGMYLIGFTTLFLGFALFSGIWIQAKKLWQQFFVCRMNNKPTGYLDAHRIIGVITLPYAAMFVLTGLIFNLVIVYQATFAFVLYQGKSNDLLFDAGYATHLKAEASGESASMSAIPELLNSTNKEKGPVHFFRIHAYGDKNAMLEIKGTHHNAQLGDEYSLYYRIASKEILFEGGHRQNQLQAGLNTLESLHYANFSGLGLKILYFLLAIGVVAMVIMGNLLWVEKRKRQTADYPKSLWIIPKMTLGICLGFLGATFLTMLADRIIPATVTLREDWLPQAFIGGLLLWVVLSFTIKSHKKLITLSLYSFMALIGLTLLAGWTQYPSEWHSWLQKVPTAVYTVDMGLVLLLALGLIIVKAQRAKSQVIE